MLSFRRLVPAVAAAIVLTGCAATQVALENKDLDVQLQASQTVFLQPVAADKKTVWIDVKNTSATDLSLAGLPALVTARGYTVVQDPNAATYWLQVNVLYVGKAAIAAIRDAVAAGFGVPLGQPLASRPTLSRLVLSAYSWVVPPRSSPAPSSRK